MIALRPLSTRLRFVALAATASAFVACRGSDAPPPTAGAQGPARAGNELSPPAEVVIGRPSAAYQADAGVAGVAITGTVTTSAELAAGAPTTTGDAAAVCGPSIPDESVVRRGNGLGGVVVWLDDVRRGRPVPIERRLELESDKCRLVPRVQAAVTGSAVNVIGHDDFRQHLRFLAGGEREPRAAVLLGRDEQVIPTERPFLAPGLVVVRDLDHPWPTAYIAVFDHPYFAVTAPDGTFRIDGVPPGRHRLKAWHERTVIADQTVDVGASGAAVSVTLGSK